MRGARVKAELWSQTTPLWSGFFDFQAQLNKCKRFGGNVVAKVIRVGLLGCGVVGGGVIDALHQNRAHIEARDDIRFEVVKVAVRDVLRHRTKRLETKLLSQDWREVCENPDVDIVVE